MCRALFAALFAVIVASAASAAIVVPGADGSDGAFAPTANYVFDLAQAATAQWDTASPNPGYGVYDPVKWAVVFKFASVNIPAGVTVTFKNHPSYAPVVWLVQGDVTIAGTVSLNGQKGHRYTEPTFQSEPGPGGFRGGHAGRNGGTAASGGLGPGGAGLNRWTSNNDAPGTGGSYYSQGQTQKAGPTRPGPVYGSASICPLIGGSGGAGSLHGDGAGGGAGGGAILVAAQGVVSLSGSLVANGGDAYTDINWERHGGCGSGGAIRIIADVANVSGTLAARGGTSSDYDGGAGRIRIERNGGSAIASDPPASIVSPSSPPKIWPYDDDPRIAVVSLGGAPVPADPKTDPVYGGAADVYFEQAGAREIVIDAYNIPLNWKMRVRMVPRSGYDTITEAVPSGGDAVHSTWKATIDIRHPGQAFGHSGPGERSVGVTDDAQASAGSL